MDIPEGYKESQRTVKSVRKMKEHRKCLNCTNEFWTRGDKVYCDKCLRIHRERGIELAIPKKLKKVIHYQLSECYNADDNHENEESKENYWDGEVWNDCDFVSFNDNPISHDILVMCIGDEIITYHEDLDSEMIELLERFYNDDYGSYFMELHTGNVYDFKEDVEYNPSLPKMWYRGGEGMYFYCHQYNYDINNRKQGFGYENESV